jgi:hypothetical protein
MQNFDLAKVGLETTLVCSISPTFWHVVSNATQSRLNVQVFERMSSNFHQGQNKTQACPNQSSPHMCIHPNHQTHNFHQKDLHLQIQNRKGENVPKQENFPTKQLKK